MRAGPRATLIGHGTTCAWAPEVGGVGLRRPLDVGAATGDFGAHAAADGWDVVACELGDSARARAAGKGLATIASLEQARDPFSLITMFHVLEHLLDPVAALKRTRSLIDSDGYLVIELSQWRGTGRIVPRSRWAQLRPPEHTKFFTKRSLALALRASGWSVVHSAMPYPRAASLAVAVAAPVAVAVARARIPREALDQVARFVVGGAGFGGYLKVGA